jgi:hypothetical protein
MQVKKITSIILIFTMLSCGIKIVREGATDTRGQKAKPQFKKASGEYDFGDFRSETLTVKAWQAMGADDLEAMEAFTGKCIELYEKEALKQQAKLKNFAPKDEAFNYWALNDVGTCYYIRGQMYLNKGMKDKAKEAFRKLVDNFYFCQCWDPNGWFWHPAEVAEEKLAELE